jgi:hypothetical protein
MKAEAVHSPNDRVLAPKPICLRPYELSDFEFVGRVPGTHLTRMLAMRPRWV